MTPEQFSRVKELFGRAVELPAADRSAFLDRESPDDMEVRLEVERLLGQETGRFGATGVRAAIGDALLDSAGGAPTLHVAELPTDPDDAAGQRIGSLEGVSVSHYDVRTRLGAGGMGEVYLAHDRALDRPVALKVLQPGFSRPIRSRLLREAWACARLQHPCIATFYEAGEADGVDFIAMEYVEGASLRDHIIEGTLSIKRSLEIVTSVLEAMVHAHFFGILHRDIKPENLMLGTDGRLKVLDFGLAKGLVDEAPAMPGSDATAQPAADPLSRVPDPSALTIDETVPDIETLLRGPLQLESMGELTHAGAIMGTLGYMPPEQLYGKSLDARADIFSTGAVLYEMLAGRAAFTGRTPRERIQAVLQHEPEPLPERIPESLREIVMQALAKEPTARFKSARDFVTAIRRYSGDTGHTARPLSLAALDLVYLGEDESRRWIAGALPDSFASSLSSIEGVTVLPRPKARAAAAAAAGEGDEPSDVDIGLGLGCDLVLSGTLQTSEAEMAVRVRLTDVATGQPLLDESIAGGRNDLFAFPVGLARAAAVALDLAAPASDAVSPDLEAYELFWRGRQLALSAEHSRMEEARDLLQEAVAISPNFAPALAQLAFLYAAKFSYTADRATLERGLEYGRRAVAADPTSAQAHLYLGYAKGAWRGDPGGFKDVTKAMELNPAEFMAPYFLASGLTFMRDPENLKAALGPATPGEPTDLHDRRRTRARELAQRAVQLNPVFGWGWLNLGWLHIEDSNFGEARWCLERAVAIEPRAVPPISGAAGYLGECLRREGLLDEARRRFHEGITTTESKDHIYRDTFRGVFLCGLGKTALAQGDTEAARVAFTQATLHLRGRPGTRCGGHALVQSLAGLARAGEGRELFEEALQLFNDRQAFDFTPIWGLFDDVDLLELARAAVVVDRRDQARALLDRAIELGSSEARSERQTP